MNAFARYIGIDYPGAETPSASLKGLRVYMADRNIAIDPNDLKAHGRPSRGGGADRNIARTKANNITRGRPSRGGAD